MKDIKIKRHSAERSSFVKRGALEEDYDTVIAENCRLIDAESGEVLGVYYHYFPHDDLDPLRAVLRRIKYQTDERTSGLKTTSRIFGYMPRIPMRADFCRSTSLAKEAPNEHRAVCSLAVPISAAYNAALPERFATHLAEVRGKVKSEYIIGETPFTSGIINKNNPLKYHFDTGNFRDVYSAMVVLKKGYSGGRLCWPEYRIALETGDGSLTLFDGQSILHGVTPFTKTSADAYRYSIVYYSLLGMWKCLEPSAEIQRIREVKTLRERKRAGI